jgi:hypothetical protein
MWCLAYRAADILGVTVSLPAGSRKSSKEHGVPNHLHPLRPPLTFALGRN